MVSMVKNSPNQQIAKLEADYSNLRREDMAKTNYAMFKMFGGGTIDYRKPGSDRPAPGEILESLNGFIRSNQG